MGIFDQTLKSLNIDDPKTKKLRDSLAASAASRKTATPAAPVDNFQETAATADKEAFGTTIASAVSEGKDINDATRIAALAATGQNSDPAQDGFSQNTSWMNDETLQELQKGVGIAETARDEAAALAQATAGKLRTRWETSVKGNIDTLTQLATDPRYLEWLGALGLNPQQMISLSQGREAHVNNYLEKVRENFNNDIAYFDNLKNLEKRANDDYEAKILVVRNEKKRIDDENKPQSKEYREIDGKPYSYNPITEELKELSFSSTTGGTVPAGLAIPGGNKYDYYINQDADGVAIRLNITEGINMDDPNTPKRNEGWCGAGMNDVMGVPGFWGDYLKDKITKRNSFTPAPGSYIIMDPGDPEQYGHVGFVEKVYADGSIDVAEFNWNSKTNPGAFGRRHIKNSAVGINNASGNPMIMGYYNPGGGEGGTTETPRGQEYKEIASVAAIGKMVYGTRISETETPRIAKLVDIGFNELGKDRFEVIADVLGYEIKKNKPLADTLISMLSQNAGEGGLSEFNVVGLANLINTDNLSGAVNLVEQSIFAKRGDTDTIGREAASIYAKSFGDDTISKIEDNLGSLGIVAGNFNKQKSKFTNNENFTEIESQLNQLVSEWRLKMAGSNITENELKFLDSVIADTKNNPFNAIQKIKSFQNGNLALLNSSRSSYNIPKLDFDTLLDKGERAKLYGSGKPEQGATQTTNTGVDLQMSNWVQQQLAAGVNPEEINAQLVEWGYDPSKY